MPVIPDKRVPELRSESDAEILQDLAHNPVAVLGVLFDRHADLVYGLALAILASPQEAEDLTQEVFLALCQRRDYDPARGSLAAFLITLTRSRAVDRLRARTRSLRLLRTWSRATIPDSGTSEPWREVFLAERSRRVRQALSQLPEGQRRALELAYYKDLSQPEIARELGAPLGTVKSWMRKGLLRLRDSLRDLCG